MYYVGRFGQPWRAPQPPVTFTFSAASGNVNLSCDTINFSYSLQDALLPKDYILPCEAVAFSYSLQDVGLKKDYVLVCEAVAFSYALQDATLGQEYRMAADTVSFSYVLQDVVFTTDPRECPDMEITVTPDGKQSTIIFPEC